MRDFALRDPSENRKRGAKVNAIHMLAHSAANDLTSPHYWDRHWDRAKQMPVGLRPWLRRRLRLGPPKLFAFLANQLDQSRPGPLDILEIGCAPGTVLANLHSLRPQHRFHGVDFAAQGLADAEHGFALTGAKVKLHQSDIRSFRPEQRYDVVYSCGLIEHFTDPLPIVKHHARLCAPGGRVIVTVPNHTGAIREYLINLMDPAGLASHNLAVMSESALRDLMLAAGLEEVVTGGFGRNVVRPICRVQRWQAHAVKLGVIAYNEVLRIIPPRLLPPHVFWASGVVRTSADS
jgi:2-polyprenyl-3-methyl-5-hydroxy-6-metoxy-1,4-benzoquinol methylase